MRASAWDMSGSERRKKNERKIKGDKKNKRRRYPSSSHEPSAAP